MTTPNQRPDSPSPGRPASSATASSPATAAPANAPRVALVTGAARRIGRGIALCLASRGWHVVIHHHRSAEAASDAVAEITARGQQAHVLGADLADIDAVRQLIPRAAEAAGAPVTCLVNNASLFLNDDLNDLDPVLWEAHMNVNLRAPVFLASAFAAHLPEGIEGNVINIIDQRVLKPAPGFFSYSASKSGLSWVTRTMAQALAPRIRVNGIAPGPVLMSIHQTPEEFAAEQQTTLLGHGTAPEEIAAAVHFLLETPSITGQMICLDGGQHLA